MLNNKKDVCYVNMKYLSLYNSVLSIHTLLYRTITKAYCKYVPMYSHVVWMFVSLQYSVPQTIVASILRSRLKRHEGHEYEFHKLQNDWTGTEILF